MTQKYRCSLLLLVATIGTSSVARAQEVSFPQSPCGTAQSLSMKPVFTGALSDLKRLGSRSSLGILAVGGIAAAGAHRVDRQVTQSSFISTESFRDTFQPGATIGGTPFALGAAFATYELGRVFHKPCAARVGADLIQAQLLAEVLTMGLKEATNRTRPDGTARSFPSGHATVAFASATVLQRHFGWKVGIPAYAVASYVAASRVQMQRHYLSDVAFGAALGIVAGRTIPMGQSHALTVGPTTTEHGGAGVALTFGDK